MQQDNKWAASCGCLIRELTELRDGDIIPPASAEYNLLDLAMDKIREYESIMELIGPPPEVDIMKELVLSGQYDA